MNEEANTTEQPVPQKAECVATRDPAVRLFIAGALFLGFGIACFLDRANYPKPDAWDLHHINEAIKYSLNHFGLYVFGPPGAIMVIWGVLFLRKRLLADADGIGYVGKEKIPWEKITELDATKLKTKGIFTLQTADGKKLVLDSWKLTNFRALVALVEEKIPSDRVKT